MKKIPVTPFSTPLSGSAKETEKRFQSILRWKKSRPPVIAMILILCACVLCCSMVACRTGGKDAADPGQTNPSELSEKYSGLTADAIPDREAVLAMSASESAWLRLAMDRISEEEYAAHFADQIAAYAASNAVPAGIDSIELTSLTAEKDTLSLVAGKNQKSLTNLTLRVEMQMKPVDAMEFFEAAEENNLALSDYLYEHTYADSKVASFEVRTVSEDGFSVPYSSERINRRETVFRQQPEDEQALQTAAFNYAQKKRDFTLTKFGARPESGDLYIEYDVRDDYLYDWDDSLENREASIREQTEKLADRSDEIMQAVLSREESGAYLQENGLTSVTVAFRNDTWEEEYRIFCRELSD